MTDDSIRVVPGLRIRSAVCGVLDRHLDGEQEMTLREAAQQALEGAEVTRAVCNRAGEKNEPN